MVRSDLNRFESANASQRLLTLVFVCVCVCVCGGGEYGVCECVCVCDYLHYPHKYLQRAKLLWKTSIGRRRPMQSDGVVHSDFIDVHRKFRLSIVKPSHRGLA